MKDRLEKIKEEALAKIEASDALERLNDIRIAYLGKKRRADQRVKEYEECSARGPP